MDLKTLKDEAMTADGFDDAIIGYGYREGNTLVIYDVPKMIKILMEQQDMTEEEAIEFFEFNVEGAWMGGNTPIYCYPLED